MAKSVENNSESLRRHIGKTLPVSHPLIGWLALWFGDVLLKNKAQIIRQDSIRECHRAQGAPGQCCIRRKGQLHVHPRQKQKAQDGLRLGHRVFCGRQLPDDGVLDCQGRWGIFLLHYMTASRRPGLRQGDLGRRQGEVPRLRVGGVHVNSGGFFFCF